MIIQKPRRHNWRQRCFAQRTQKVVSWYECYHEVCTSLEEFSGVIFTSSEQHKDLGQARRSRDTADIVKFNQWFDSHPPFPETSLITSISSGVDGDATITCYDAVRVGKRAMNFNS